MLLPLQLLMSLARCSMHEMLLGIGRRPLSADPDVDSFLYRVAMNGGSVQPSTKTSIETFVASTKASGVWPLLSRINLFCGDSIKAAAVPLKAGSGFKLDSLVNITASDYSETGLSGGFKGNASNKYIDTGLTPSTLPAFNNHLSVFQVAFPSGSAVVSSHGCGDSTGAIRFAIFDSLGSRTIRTDFYNDAGGRSVLGAYSVVQGIILVSRSSASFAKTYSGNDSLVNTNTVPNSIPTAQTVKILGTEGSWSNGIYGAYSVGTSMTDANFADFKSAMTAFQTSLGRVA